MHCVKYANIPLKVGHPDPDYTLHCLRWSFMSVFNSEIIIDLNWYNLLRQIFLRIANLFSPITGSILLSSLELDNMWTNILSILRKVLTNTFILIPIINCLVMLLDFNPRTFFSGNFHWLEIIKLIFYHRYNAKHKHWIKTHIKCK